MLFVHDALAESEKIEKVFDVSAGGTLIIDSDRGSVTINTWSQNRVEIQITKTASTSARLGTFEFNFSQSGNSVVIEGQGQRKSLVRVAIGVNVPEHFNFDINTRGGRISIDDITGDITLRTSGGNIKTGNVVGDVDLSTSGGSIQIGRITGRSIINTSGGSITVAGGGLSTDADTSGGSIAIGPSEGDVRVRTSGGSISIADISGDVSANTSGGGIDIGQVQGNIKADTSGGSIRVQGGEGIVDINSSGGSLRVHHAGGLVRARTSGGHIFIEDAEGAIDAKTSGGNIEAHMVQIDNNVNTRIILRSSGGTLTLYIPKSLQASVIAEIRITRNALQDYSIYSDFPIAIKGDGGNDVKASGDLNGGGDMITLKTTNGDIYINYLD